MPAVKTRFFPILWLIIAGLFLLYFSRYRYGVVLTSLSHFTFTLSYFLFLITVFFELNKHSEWIREKCLFIASKIAALFKKIFKIREKEKMPASQNAQQEASQAAPNDGGLIEIKKQTVRQEGETRVSVEKRIIGILFVLSFLCLAWWRINGMFKLMPLSYVVPYRSNIIIAVLALIAPCVAVLYLKIRKDGADYTDKISRDLLKLFAYVSFAYAAVIAASSVLNLNLLVVLRWVFYFVTAYLTGAFAVNVLLSFLKGDVLNFDYVLFPKISRAAWEEQTAKWKVSIKSLYTIRYTLKILPALVLALLFVLFISTSVFVVQPHQQAAVYHLGKLQPSSIKNEGLHFKFPWPVDKAEIYDVHRVSSMQIGYEASGRSNFLWGKGHDGGEYMLLLGNGNEIAAVNLKLMYVISDLFSYIKTSADPQAVLSAAAYNALMSRTINTTLDSFLSVDRNSLAESVLDELSQFCRRENLGFSVVQVVIESIHPPVEIADVYQNVVSASVDKTAAIIRAHTYAESKITEAVKDSRAAIDQARAVQFDRVSSAQREMAVFNGAMEAYRASPASFDLSKRLDVYEKIISGNKVYVFSPGAQRDISKFIIGKVNTVNVSDLNKGEEP